MLSYINKHIHKKVNCCICNTEIYWEIWMAYHPAGKICKKCYSEYGMQIEVIARKAALKAIEKSKIKEK